MYKIGDKVKIIDHSRFLPGDIVEILSKKLYNNQYRCKRVGGSQLEYYVKEDQMEPIKNE